MSGPEKLFIIDDRLAEVVGAEEALANLIDDGVIYLATVHDIASSFSVAVSEMPEGVRFKAQFYTVPPSPEGGE